MPTARAPKGTPLPPDVALHRPFLRPHVRQFRRGRRLRARFRAKAEATDRPRYPS